MNRINPGDQIDATVLDSNFQELLARFGNLTDADFSTNANLNGSKVAVNTMPGDRIASGSIGVTQMGAQSVGATQLVDLSITKGKHSTTTGQRITAAQTEMARQSVAFSIAGVGGSTYLGGTLLITQSGGNYLAQIAWLLKNNSTNAVTVGFQTVTPTTPIPTASNMLVALTLESTAGIGSANAAWQGNVYFTSIALT